MTMYVYVSVAQVAKVVGGVLLAYVAARIAMWLSSEELWMRIPSVSVPAELGEPPVKGRKFDLRAHERKQDLSVVKCWDPASLDDLGVVAVTTNVEELIARAGEAQAEWAASPWSQRRKLLRTLLKWCVAEQATIAKVAARDSGKTLTDAVFGEILVTCEKLQWLAANCESVLKTEFREPGTTVMFTKKVKVEYRPVGVVLAIVPWNYPFHNVLNPASAALAAGNAIVIKVSEYASWSTAYIGEGIRRCLAACGAPEDLVQFAHGFADVGSKLVKSPKVDKIIFVGSPQVGIKVMEAAAANLTPVVLELGGKDPFVVCGDVRKTELERIVQIALRGVFQSMGQNCAGPERFFVAKEVYEDFCAQVAEITKRMTLGASVVSSDSSSPVVVDCGAVTMGTPALRRLQDLVDDAVKKGATVLVGGDWSESSSSSSSKYPPSFYPPTILRDVPSSSAKIAQDEIFGPIMCIFEPCTSDDDAIARANDCAFALSSCAFAQDPRRASRVASQLKAGMSSVNDLEGTTYLSQSLPFGGLGFSGFDRFAGPEGLRGLCNVRSVCEDKFPTLLRTAIPGPIQYPCAATKKHKPHIFAQGIVQLFYGDGIIDKLRGIAKIISAS
mmetsp:Transcript_1391/g.4752  ORF Transcript_1391/g.4752 Transcript_1391/m.4752 type:complete len:614 (-) Transcript_1391:272-2113(-)